MSRHQAARAVKPRAAWGLLLATPYRKGDTMADDSPRDRYRRQLRSEIKQHAWEQIATAGASALALKAIAKQLGMSGPALYRYYPSRDDLISELIREAYRSLADALTAGPAGPAGRAPRTDFDEHLERTLHEPSGETVHQALIFWSRLHGVLSLELAGHYDGIGFDPAKLFEAELADLGWRGRVRTEAGRRP